jgi:hypothetical protein
MYKSIGANCFPSSVIVSNPYSIPSVNRLSVCEGHFSLASGLHGYTLTSSSIYSQRHILSATFLIFIREVLSLRQGLDPYDPGPTATEEQSSKSMLAISSRRVMMLKETGGKVPKSEGFSPLEGGIGVLILYIPVESSSRLMNLRSRAARAKLIRVNAEAIAVLAPSQQEHRHVSAWKLPLSVYS